MNFVIPMAGKGQRFVDAGYHIPKMLIVAKGKTLLEWSVDSLPLELCTNLVFVLLEEHQRMHNVIEFVQQKYQNRCKLSFVTLQGVTRGQAETVLKAKNKLDVEKQILIFNVDTYFHSDTLKERLLKASVDGIIGSFTETEGAARFSFAQTDHAGQVVKVAEKERISENALTGLYHFSNTTDFIRIAEKNIALQNTTKGEFYIAPMYNDLIAEGKRFFLDRCSKHAILGTPEELNTFIND